MSIHLALTNSGGREFQMFTILLEKKSLFANCQLLLQICFNGLISHTLVSTVLSFKHNSLQLQLLNSHPTIFILHLPILPPHPRPSHLDIHLSNLPSIPRYNAYHRDHYYSCSHFPTELTVCSTHDPSDPFD